jgi:hypothetical protein
MGLKETIVDLDRTLQEIAACIAEIESKVASLILRADRARGSTASNSTSLNPWPDRDDITYMQIQAWQRCRKEAPTQELRDFAELQIRRLRDEHLRPNAVSFP